MRTRVSSKKIAARCKTPMNSPQNKKWAFVDVGTIILLLLIRRMLYPIFIFCVYFMARSGAPFVLDWEWFFPQPPSVPSVEVRKRTPSLKRNISSDPLLFKWGMPRVLRGIFIRSGYLIWQLHHQ